MKESRKMWVICTDRVILPITVQNTKKQTIKEFEEWTGRSWKEMQEAGYMVKKCVIRILE